MNRRAFLDGRAAWREAPSAQQALSRYCAQTSSMWFVNTADAIARVSALLNAPPAGSFRTGAGAVPARSAAPIHT